MAGDRFSNYEMQSIAAEAEKNNPIRAAQAVLLTVASLAKLLYNSKNFLSVIDDMRETTVKNTILDVFAGPSDKGIYSPSVQQTQYLTQKKILLGNPQIEDVKMSMPNRHYFPVDFTKFPIPGITGKGAGQVLLPVDKPSGMITSKLARSQIMSKL